MKNTAAVCVSTILLNQRKRINAMFEFLAFCVLFGVFMLRAHALDWESIVSSVYDEDIHGISFLILSAVSFGILLVVMVGVTNVKVWLDTEYKGIYVTPAEFRAAVGRAEVGAAKFSENVKCEIDAD